MKAKPGAPRTRAYTTLEVLMELAEQSVHQAAEKLALRNKDLLALSEECPHHSLVETDRIDSGVRTFRLPRRLCLDCHLEESDRSGRAQFSVLNEKARLVSHEEFFNLRSKLDWYFEIARCGCGTVFVAAQSSNSTRCYVCTH